MLSQVFVSLGLSVAAAQLGMGFPIAPLLEFAWMYVLISGRWSISFSCIRGVHIFPLAVFFIALGR